MDAERLTQLLERVRSGKLAVAHALVQLRHLPYEDLGFAKIDHHRALRQGFPEVVMGQGKQTKEIAAIVAACIITYLVFLFAEWIVKVLGVGGLRVLSRLMGLLLAVIAVQFMVNGFQQIR